MTKPFKIGNRNKNSELIKILAKKLEIVHLTTTDPSSSKQQLNVLSGSESSYTETKTDNSDKGQLNIITHHQTRTKNYYPRPTPPDLQYEERFPLRSMYTSKGLYEWNIDGCLEHEIMNILHEMLMAATAYSTENKDHEVVEFLLAGFTEILRGWWENSLNDEERRFIKTSINETTGEQNAVYRLVYTISKHFIGDNKILQE